MAGIPNPFANQDLFLSKTFHEHHVDHLVGRGDVRKPFPRQIDLWWLALCFGRRIGYRTQLGDRGTLVKFNDGGILSSDPWRITHLELLSLAELGEKGLEDPAQTIQVANEYVATGLSVIDDLCTGAPEPTLTLATRMVEHGPAPAE